MIDLNSYIRDVPDFPKPGIVFKDITPLLENPKALGKVIDIMAERYQGEKIDKIAAVESRGFIFGAPLSVKMDVGFVPVRKEGKLPWTKISEEYVLEYGTDKLEMHADSLNPGDRVLVIDDLLATGGTVGAVCNLVEKQKAIVASLAFVVELSFLNGREKFNDKDIFSILKYD